jgi:hypothetical protein
MFHQRDCAPLGMIVAIATVLFLSIILLRIL